MKESKGFTLIELMVAIAVFGILIAIAAPNMARWRESQRLSSGAREVLSALQFARIRAVKDNASVVFSIDPDNDGTLNNDYIVFIDDGAGGGTADDRILNGGERVVKRGGMPAGILLTDNQNQTVRFNGRGLSNLASITFKVTNSRGNEKDIVVTITGKSWIE